jgi:hypothetical protein
LPAFTFLFFCSALDLPVFAILESLTAECQLADAAGSSARGELSAAASEWINENRRHWSESTS